MTVARFPDASALLKALLAHARRRGVRRIEATPVGTVVVDGVGRRLPVTLGGAPRLAAHEDLPAHLGKADWDGSWMRRGERDQGELGEWEFEVGTDVLVLKPVKPTPACVDVLFPEAPEGMDEVRALYGRPGAGIVVLCDGDARARDLALAMACEASALGSAVTFEQALGVVRYRRSGATDDEHLGVEPFDQPNRAGVAPTEVLLSRQVGASPCVDGVTRVTVVATTRDWRWREPDLGALARSDAPVATVRVFLAREDSKARMDVVLSDAARALATDPLPVPRDVPWVAYKAARDARAPRTTKPRTWHRTTDQVAAAFAAREAPRGTVAGESLYFHGPVAFSISDRNPVAAYVTGRDGAEVLVRGRAEVSGLASRMAAHAAGQDVSRWLPPETEELDLGMPLDGILRWDGSPPSEVARRLRHARHESPPTVPCVVDAEALGRALRERFDALRTEERGIHVRQTFPTKGHARAVTAILELVLLRDRAVERLGIDLPSLADVSTLRAEAEASFRANAAHLAERARLKAGTSADEPGDAPRGP